MASSDMIVGGKSQVVILYEMCSVKKTLDAIREPNICAVARMLVRELQDITGVMRRWPIKVKL